MYTHSLFPIPQVTSVSGIGPAEGSPLGKESWTLSQACSSLHPRPLQSHQPQVDGTGMGYLLPLSGLNLIRSRTGKIPHRPWEVYELYIKEDTISIK